MSNFRIFLRCLIMDIQDYRVFKKMDRVYSMTPSFLKATGKILLSEFLPSCSAYSTPGKQEKRNCRLEPVLPALVQMSGTRRDFCYCRQSLQYIALYIYMWLYIYVYICRHRRLLLGAVSFQTKLISCQIIVLGGFSNQLDQFF